jgi:hypothetical protein
MHTCAVARAVCTFLCVCMWAGVARLSIDCAIHDRGDVLSLCTSSEATATATEHELRSKMGWLGNHYMQRASHYTHARPVLMHQNCSLQVCRHSRLTLLVGRACCHAAVQTNMRQNSAPRQCTRPAARCFRRHATARLNVYAQTVAPSTRYLVANILCKLQNEWCSH